MSQTTDKLVVEVREEVGSPACRRLRKAGMVPCVVYTGGKEAFNVKADTAELEKAIASPHIIDMAITGQDTKQVLVQEAQWNHLAGELTHVDFLEVAMDQKIHTDVPIVPVGETKGAMTGGTLDQLIHKLEIECLPGNLPEKLEIDVTALETGAHLNVSDVTFPEGVTPRVDGTVCIFHVVPPRVEAEAVADEEAAE
ncbi:hypothetical protein BVY04_00860 [bacterium M21]|nr:hypothetical protein BVY04_00860 [bacterium M21]